MRVLVAYDGSKGSETALQAVAHAGLAEMGKMAVISISERWLGQSAVSPRSFGSRGSERASFASRLSSISPEAETLAHHAKRRLAAEFPLWAISSYSAYGSPAYEILTFADRFAPDLIIVGANGRSTQSGRELGSTVRKIMAEANCSVRVVRAQNQKHLSGRRSIIGFDGTAGSAAAINAVAERDMEKPCEVRMVVAADNIQPAEIDRFVNAARAATDRLPLSEMAMIEGLAEDAIDRLERNNCSATLAVRVGNPKDVIIREADLWNADVILLGANDSGRARGRFNLGTTAASVAARANCSVELVREKITPDDLF